MSDELRETSAFVIRSLETPWRAGVEQWPISRPGPDQVLLDVRASAVSYYDVLFSRGQYQVKPELPVVPGTCAVGSVRARGELVDWCDVGDDLVVQNPEGGSLARNILADRSRAVRIPQGIDPVLLVAAVEAWSTMHFAFTERVPLTGKESVLVLGAGGGIGGAAVDVARAAGCTVIAAASSEQTRARARAFDAAAVVDTSNKDWPRQVANLVPAGVDVVVDPVGGDAALGAVRLLAEGGRYAVLGFASGDIPRFGLNRILIENRAVVGVDYGDATRSRADLRVTVLSKVVQLIVEGKYRPVPPSTARLLEAVDVFEKVWDRSSTDRWVITFGEEVYAQ